MATRTRAGLAAVTLGGLTLVAGLAGTAGAAAPPPRVPGTGNADNVTLCHATSSDTNPYVAVTVDPAGAYNGHLDHTGPIWAPTPEQGGGKPTQWGDIIPPFSFDGDDHQLNWDVLGQAILANGCAIPTGAPSLEVSTVTVPPSEILSSGTATTDVPSSGTVTTDVPSSGTVTTDVPTTENPTTGDVITGEPATEEPVESTGGGDPVFSYPAETDPADSDEPDPSVDDSQSFPEDDAAGGDASGSQSLGIAGVETSRAEGGADVASAGQGELAETGSPNAVLIGLGLALVVGGIGVTDIGRRRRVRRPRHR